MKKLLALPVLALLLAACSVKPEPQVVEVTVIVESPAITITATPEPVTETTEVPPTPAPTPGPTSAPVTIDAIELALREDGFKRSPFIADGKWGWEKGTRGFAWSGRVYSSWANTSSEIGVVEVSVINDDNYRALQMEAMLAILETVFPADFMRELRVAHQSYIHTAGTSVSGEPAWISTYGDEWQQTQGVYNLKHVAIGDYGVQLGLVWWQFTCPDQYDYCYYDAFPGLEFTSDSSWVGYFISIQLPDAAPIDSYSS